MDAVNPIASNWIERTGKIPNLHPSDLRQLGRIASEPIPKGRLALGHGRLSARKLVSLGGEFAGIVDWRWAGWWPPEWDYALLPSVALRQVMDWPFEPVDWSLVATLRVVWFLDELAASRAPLAALHEAMGFWELMR
jgi:hypothetical protein